MDPDAPQRKPRPRRRRRRDPLEARDAVLSALGKLGLTDHARRLRIFLCWNEVVGERIAARTEPFTFSRGVLTLRTHNPAWQNELTYLKAELIEKLNAALGAKVVREIKLVAGRIRPGRRGLQGRALPPATAEERAHVTQVSNIIEDPEVRASFAAMMEKETRARRG